jgi:hypothetical protein
MIKKKPNHTRRWVIQYDKNDKIEEVRLIWKDTYEGDRKIYTDKTLAEKLEKIKNK